jgi:AcrR family transcriptional regulator
VASGGSGPAVQTRQRILDIATDLFRDRGYAGTSIRDIAEALGMTKAALYYHFACKDDVLSALIGPTAVAIEEFLARAEPATDADPGEFLRELVGVLAASAPTLATALSDPMILRSGDVRFRFIDKFHRIAVLLAGENADSDRLIRAYAALGAIKAGIEAAILVEMDPDRPACAPYSVKGSIENHLGTITTAGIAALRG